MIPLLIRSAALLERAAQVPRRRSAPASCRESASALGPIAHSADCTSNAQRVQRMNHKEAFCRIVVRNEASSPKYGMISGRCNRAATSTEVLKLGCENL